MLYNIYSNKTQDERDETGHFSICYLLLAGGFGYSKFYFTHNFYKDLKPQSSFFPMLDNLLNKLKIKSLIRIKGNLHIKSDKFKYNNFHTDYSFTHKGCILYINDNNGFTYFKESDKKVKPKANRIVLFDPSIEHKSSRCSDSKIRVNININYF